MTAPPRRVVFVAPSLGQGGADRVVASWLTHLDRQHFAPELVLLRAGAIEHEVPADVPVRRLRAERIRTAMPALVAELVGQRPDVVVSMYSGVNAVLAGAHVLARSTARLIVSERTTLTRADWSPTRNRLEPLVKRLAYRRADAIIVPSHGLARQLVAQLHLPAGRVTVVPNPVVDDDVAALAAASLDDPWFVPGAPPVVLAVGRLVEVKDYPTMLDALARVAAASPAPRAPRLAILGDGPARPALVERARALGLADQVRFLGFDPNPFRYMARATALVHTSVAEGFPNVLVQAMACGLPVIATDCEVGPAEIIRNADEGRLVPVGDVAAVAAALAEVLGSPTRRAAMRQAGLARAATYSRAAALAALSALLRGPETAR